MKLRQLCDNLGIKYNEKNPKLSLNKIKKIIWSNKMVIKRTIL